MKKNYFIGIFVMMLVCVQVVCGQAKYVFFFIGDGMGVNQVNITEAYLSALNGERGSVSLLMTQFPVASMASTFSADNDVTESAAAGTALATGFKTKNGYIGVDPEFNRLESLAEKAKKAGKKVGVTTTVTINHATPAAFYAHQKSRNMYYEIARDIIQSDMDFFAGGGFANREMYYDNTKAPDIYPLIEQAGYFIAKGYNDFKSNAGKAKKVVLVHENWERPSGIPYAIDRAANDLTLPQITEAAIDVLMRDNKKGFFVMIEAGQIDGGGHSNDGATTIKEVIDLNEAVKVAYEFYKKYPKETLIVIAADHETGGLTAGKGSLSIQMLQHQKMSQGKLQSRMNELFTSKNGAASWDDVKGLLTETMGFWREVPVRWTYEKELRDAYEEIMAKKQASSEPLLTADFTTLATKAKQVINEIAGLGWSTGSHSAGFIPVFAIGAGQELFKGKMHISDISKNISKAANY